MTNPHILLLLFLSFVSPLSSSLLLSKEEFFFPSFLFNMSVSFLHHYRLKGWWLFFPPDPKSLIEGGKNGRYLFVEERKTTCGTCSVLPSASISNKMLASSSASLQKKKSVVFLAATFSFFTCRDEEGTHIFILFLFKYDLCLSTKAGKITLGAVIFFLRSSYSLPKLTPYH